MKNGLIHALIFLFIVTLLPVTAQQKLDFDESGYQSILARAKKEQKPIFYMMYASWCSHCNKMKSEVFTDTLVINFMKKNFICASQDIEKGEGDFFRKKFGIRFYPTFLFLDEDGKELYHTSGEFTPTNLIAEAQNAMTKEKQFPYLEQQFLSDVSNSDKCLAYLMALNKGRDRNLLAPIAMKYLATQSENQLISANNWKIIANGVTDPQSREFQFVLQHQKEFEAVASQKRVQRKIENIVVELLTPALEYKDTVAYAKKRLIAKTIQTAKNDSLVNSFDMQMAEQTKNWKKYTQVTTASVNKYYAKDARILKEVASNYLKNVSNPEGIKTAIGWALQALTISETYDTQILLARLYQKNKNLKEAINYANAAKNKNGAIGFSTKEADELLLELKSKH
jgi:thioredoxin-related protein